MLVTDLQRIGEKLFRIRQQKGMKRLEVAERAGLSDRTYADIERGSVNMRLETLLKICLALGITPNDILVQSSFPAATPEQLAECVKDCSSAEIKRIMELIEIFLSSKNI